MARLCFLLSLVFILGISRSQFRRRHFQVRYHGRSLQWTQWSPCSVTCGRGIRYRQQNCNIYRHSRRYRSQCPTERQICYRPACNSYGRFNIWSQWSSCSVTCGGGQRTRSRLCNQHTRRCYYPNNRVERRNCNINLCPRNGGFSGWSQWSLCSRSCGGGQQIRHRTCTNPVPAYGGLRCRGNFDAARTCNDHHCPVNRGFSNWNAWSSCSVSCGNGTMSRSRTCTNRSPAYGGRYCSGDFVEVLNCNLLQCPLDGGFSNWNAWSVCSVTCGNGTMSRSRTCTYPSPAYGGRNCSGDFVEVLNCNILRCPVNGGFSNWNSWSSCSITCGNGTMSRSRACNNPLPANGGRNCSGDSVEVLNCNSFQCPVNGGFSNWNAWSSCSVTCGNGTMSRSRACNNPLPAHGGRYCSGDLVEVLNCNLLRCPVDGGFSNWNTWSSCSVTCGNGTMSRSRTCNNPLPAHGGRNCSGDFVEVLNCNLLQCPVDGGFSNWNAWSTCSVTCGNGTMSRSRTCNNPLPAHGGRNCSGDFVEVLFCNSFQCPVDGGFSNWNAWSSCSVTCGNGTMSRSRTCNNPLPAHGGRNCSGVFVEVLNCNLLQCPVDGGFSNWNTWSGCSVTCGNGTMSRSRNCNNPLPAHGGRNCSGDFVEVLNCNLLQCPVNGGFSNWNAWSSCSVTCGNGTMSRSRTCNNPLPAYGGRNCSGDFVEVLNCNLLQCPVDGGFSNWNTWSSCSVTCGNGTMSRSRTCNNPLPAHGGRNCSDDFVEILNCNLLQCSVCAPGQFECDDKTCISGNMACDGYPDCADRSDENGEHCTINDRCPEGQTRCSNGQCVSQGDLCGSST